IVQERAPRTPSGRKAKVFFATQIDIAPPTIALVVNNPAFFEDSYQRHIINRMRDLLPYPEVPIRLLIRPRGQRTTEAALDELDEKGAGEAGAKVKVPKTGRRRARSRARPSAQQNRAKNRGREREGGGRAQGHGPGNMAMATS